MTAPVVFAIGILTVAVCIMASTGNSGEALMLAFGLIPMVGLLAWRAHQKVRALHHHAWRNADAAAEAEQHYFQVLRNIVNVVEARDPHKSGRSDRISRLCERMALAMGLSSQRAKLLGMIGQVHDIGLLAVSDKVLQKTTQLGDQEFGRIRQHPEVGYGVLKPLTFLADVLPAVRFHHERMNGTGYPCGLRGQEIPIEARILAVAETFDAISHDRPYGRALTPPEAIAEVARCTGDGFERACVIALAKTLHMTHLLPVEWSCKPVTIESESPHSAAESPQLVAG